MTGVHDAFAGTSSYPGARARDGRDGALVEEADGSYRTGAGVSPGDTVALGLVGVGPDDLPSGAKAAYGAAGRDAADDEVRGVVYLDFTPGGGRGRAGSTGARAGCPR